MTPWCITKPWASAQTDRVYIYVKRLGGGNGSRKVKPMRTPERGGMCLDWRLTHGTKSYLQPITPPTHVNVNRCVCVCENVLTDNFIHPDFYCLCGGASSRKNVLIHCHTWLSIHHQTLLGFTKRPGRGGGAERGATQEGSGCGEKKGVKLVRHAHPWPPDSLLPAPRSPYSKHTHTLQILFCLIKICRY